MPTRPAKVPWPREDHTAVKHDIYGRYLERWWPILIKGAGWNGDVTYAEGFAGPGVYEAGEVGSPAIALHKLLSDRSLLEPLSKARLLLVDADKRCTDCLRTELEKVRVGWTPDKYREFGIDIRIVTGTCEPALETLMDETGAWGHPMLVVLDTFGGAVSARLLHRVAKNKAGEVFVTFQPQYFARFAGNEDVGDGDDVFGDSSWRDVRDQPSDQKTRWLLNRYRRTVEAAGFGYVLDFELVDRRGTSLYLVFGTNHSRGFEKMKEVMWEVDDVAGVRYRDPRDPGQGTLAIETEPNTAPLRRILLDFPSDGREVPVARLRGYANASTVYKASHVMPELRRLVTDGLVETVGGGTLSFAGTVRVVTRTETRE